MKVFLSYPSEHVGAAREVKGFVCSVGVTCWFDRDSLVAGEDWDRARRTAQSEADIVMILCASQTNERDGVYQREIQEALEALREKRLGSVYIIPVRLEDVPLPPELSRLQYVDHFDGTWRRRLAGGLLRAVRDSREVPPPPLEVAGAQSDEGGTVPRKITEERPEGRLYLNWYQYTLQSDYWDFVNAAITARALGGLYAARRQLAEWHQKSGSDWALHISEFHRKGQLISIVMAHSSYFAGAAHPNHGIETVNILGEDGGIVSAKEIFDYSSEALQFITDYVNLDLRRQFSGRGETLNLSNYVDTYGWELYEQFTFNETGMRFNFSSISGLPHVLGYLDVYVPWEHVAQYLAPIPKRILLGKKNYK